MLKRHQILRNNMADKFKLCGVCLCMQSIFPVQLLPILWCSIIYCLGLRLHVLMVMVLGSLLKKKKSKEFQILFIFTAVGWQLTKFGEITQIIIPPKVLLLFIKNRFLKNKLYTVVWWFALLPQRVPGSTPGVCVGSLRVLRLPPTV